MSGFLKLKKRGGAADMISICLAKVILNSWLIITITIIIKSTVPLYEILTSEKTKRFLCIVYKVCYLYY